MLNNLKIATAQLNFKVGDFRANRDKIIAAHSKAAIEGANLVVFSELAIIGYPPEDLVLRSDFQDKSIKAVREIAKITEDGTAILLGCLWREGDKIYNAALLLDDGEIKNITCKYELPNYGVFDEKRVFAQGPLPEPIKFRGVKLGVMICEDMWGMKIAKHLAKQGAEILIVLNASPFESQKTSARIAIAEKNVKATKLPLIYVNQIGGQDELVFDGSSFALSADAKLKAALPAWKESVKIIEWYRGKKGWQCDNKKPKIETEKYCDIYEALKLGLQDYVEKNGFPGVVIGMSGGIDSALSAAVAVDALGAKSVELIMMPSKYTSQESMHDARECAKLLGVDLREIPIGKTVVEFEDMLKETFAGEKTDTTEENLQSRIRGNILMAFSNKFGHMVLTTGNKSEMAVGYATLYGDMCGGYNVLKDIYKTDVFALCKWRNKIARVIPENIISKAPTAELRPDQKDEDSLPPYNVLDKVLHKFIELKLSSEDIIKSGHDPEVVNKIARLLKLAEYKRRQAAPGVKISNLAFGRDRRYPITSGFGF